MGYDRAITLFSPDGRLLQVEYARKTVSQGSATIGLVGKDSIVFVADKRLPEVEKLIVPESIEKVFEVDEHLGAAISGMIADGHALIGKAQVSAQQYRITYNDPADIVLLIKEISAEMQAFTQYGGARPYGVSILFGGIKSDKPMLYMLEPSGIFFRYKAIAIGENSSEINKYLESNYKEGLDEESLIKIAVKSLKAGSVKISADRFEIATVSNRGFRKFSKEEAEKYI
jgi:proteasome alpha subunit